MNIEQFRKAAYQAIDRICDYYYSLENLPVASVVKPGYLRPLLPATAPEKGEDIQVIADDYMKYIMPGLTHWQSPSFFGYFPTACSFEAIIGDLYATSITNPGFNWSCSPAATELEPIVMDWAAHLLGLDKAFFNSLGIGGGAMQTTASDSALIATVAARSRYQSKHPGVAMEQLVIYATSQTHSLGSKAGLVLGLQVRILDVKAEDNFALRGSELKNALKQDIKGRKHPFFLIATIGTTSSGAIDCIDEVGKVVKETHPDMWVHIDAAWAGLALACPEHRERLALPGINQYGDSFCANFHKWGLTNFDASTLWVRDRKALTNALDITPPFLRTAHGDAGTVTDYRNWHLALGRRFRSLKLWFVLRGFGVEGLQNYLRKTIALGQEFAALVESSSILKVVTPPSLSLTVFRICPQGNASEEELNAVNRRFFERISLRNDILVTQTVLNDIFCIRFAVGAIRTETRHIKTAYELLTKEAEETLAEWKDGKIVAGDRIYARDTRLPMPASIGSAIPGSRSPANVRYLGKL